jgi:hypothetical protein
MTRNVIDLTGHPEKKTVRSEKRRDIIRTNAAELKKASVNT